MDGVEYMLNPSLSSMDLLSKADLTSRRSILNEAFVIKQNEEEEEDEVDEGGLDAQPLDAKRERDAISKIPMDCDSKFTKKIRPKDGVDKKTVEWRQEKKVQ